MTLLNDFDRSTYAARKPGLLPRFSQWLAAVLAARRARAELDTIVRFHQSRGSPPIPRHLRRDLGLPEEDGQWWRAMDRW